LRSRRLGATFKKVDKTIAWFEQISRKFSIISDEIIGLGKHDIVLTCEHDKRYRTSKTTKTNPLDCFSKIYYFVPHNKVCANSVADCCSSKLQIFSFNFAKQMTDVNQSRKRKPG
jgi:hypothetical protein